MLSNDQLLLRRVKYCNIDREKLVESFTKNIGKKYGYLDLLLIAIARITKKRLFKGTANRLICSEAVARILYDATDKQINFEKEFNKPYSYITPDDIFMSKQLKTVRL